VTREHCDVLIVAREKQVAGAQADGMIDDFAVNP